ncbi:MAG: Chromosome segregation ATPase-like protein, partial [Solirubrobacterales bacterium]|nr:Chromosome segregation ATPase-like protein [Solirubrobacterales bacterium]
EERTARWVAEQELAVERERGTEPGTFLTASLNRTELEATRRELAAAQEQLAAEHLRQSASAGPASKLVRDLEAAGARLKEGAGDEPGDAPDVVPVVDGTAAAAAGIAAAASDQAAADDVSQDSGIPTSSRDALAAALAALTASTPPATAEAGDAPDPASMRPADAVAAAFASAAAGGDQAGPSPDDSDPARPVLLAPPAGATPLSPRVVRAFERPQVGWLAPAIAKLAKEDEKLAAELIVELLPGQAGVVRDQLAYGVTIDGHGSYRVAISPERALVEPREGAFWPDDVEASISGSPAALAPLVAGLARRKLSGTKLDGRKRRLRKVLRGRRGPVDLGQLAERGIRPSPEPLLAVLAAAVEPTWTAGHSFVVVYALAGGKAIEVEVRNGQPLRIQTGVRAPTEPPAATIALRDVALLPLLAHTDLPAGERVFVAGDRHAVALLHSWFDRAQGLPAA